ncbi:DUF2971 domain-containing protein [Clostridium cochlearium]|uniref:DUF2971 domain-containing protein n=1 Tax=Clostridium cochlearium TaxID=1494 RepID=UPI001459E80B|nr:DUF2971 domain-containing protein [Clostridium cochlearium]NME94735.1 DUF2971 domain-containing protein [Clostridium cochlearium]
MSNIYYHYCSLKTFFEIIKSQNIRLCDSYKMKDREENKLANKILKDEFKEFFDIIKYEDKIYLENFKEQYFNSDLGEFKSHIPYIASFSKESDIQSQWEKYADDERGVAIGFNFNKLGISEVGKKSYFDIYKEDSNGIKYYDYIEYNLEKQKKKIRKLLQEYINGINKNTIKGNLFPLMDLIEALKLTSINFKREKYLSEDEVRIIYIIALDSKNNELEYGFYTKNGQKIKFFELSFKPTKEVIPKIILGSKCKMKENYMELRKYLDKNGLTGTKIISCK